MRKCSGSSYCQSASDGTYWNNFLSVAFTGVSTSSIQVGKEKEKNSKINEKKRSLKLLLQVHYVYVNGRIKANKEKKWNIWPHILVCVLQADKYIPIWSGTLSKSHGLTRSSSPESHLSKIRNKRNYIFRAKDNFSFACL